MILIQINLHFLNIVISILPVDRISKRAIFILVRLLDFLFGKIPEMLCLLQIRIVLTILELSILFQ